MFSLSCPACGGEIVFKSRASVFAVCPYCKSTVVRQDMDLETYGSVADVQWDQPPLQIGTRGKYGINAFEVIGRYRMAWEDGYWNEWYLLFEDGTEAWLAEAQGFYSVCIEDLENMPPELRELKTGTKLRFAGNSNAYEVDDIKNAKCIGAEGELPLKIPKAWVCTNVDLTADDGSFASIQYGERKPAVYFGEYIEFDQFEFTLLRDLDGWEYTKRETTLR